MNRIKNLVWFAAGLAAVATVITIGTETKAVAQAVRAALVRNQDEPGRNPYSQIKECVGTGCILVFAPVPPGQRLVVTFVNAGIGESNGSPLILGGHGGELRFFATTNSALGIVNTPTVAYYDVGETPTLVCESCSDLVMDGTLSGYFVALP